MLRPTYFKETHFRLNGMDENSVLPMEVVINMSGKSVIFVTDFAS